MLTPNTNERKWRQPQLHLITKSCSRQELGLPTSSAAVLPLKMMLCTVFQSIQTFSVNGKFTERYHIFCARIDLLLTIFICSCYRPLLHHFVFVMCLNSRLYCPYFSAIDAKYVMFHVSWHKSLKGSATPVWSTFAIGSLTINPFLLCVNGSKMNAAFSWRKLTAGQTVFNGLCHLWSHYKLCDVIVILIVVT